MKEAIGTENRYHLRLTAEKKGIHLNLKELWRYRDLVRLLTRKTFSLTYQQTILGPLWIVINPAISSLIYMFLFGYVAKIGTGGIPMVLFYFVSASLWEVFAQSLATNSGVFVQNANLFGKVYFPRLAVPVSNTLVCLLKYCVQMLIVGTSLAVFTIRGEVHPHWELYPILPLLLLQMAVLGMSIGVLISSLTAKYRDLLSVVAVGINLFMYATPIAYPLSALPEGILKTAVKLNPVTEIVEGFRLIMLGNGEVEWPFGLIGMGLTLLLFVFSAANFNRVERTFLDTV